MKTVQKNSEKNIGRLNINFVDLGEVGLFGRPKSYIKQNDFCKYTEYIWRQTDRPSLVLIDGRFRVCCFLTSLKFADEGTKIIFDDYTNRSHYHFVEKYVSCSIQCGRQCLFVVPSKDNIDMDELERDIVAFQNVMD